MIKENHIGFKEQHYGDKRLNENDKKNSIIINSLKLLFQIQYVNFSIYVILSLEKSKNLYMFLTFLIRLVQT